MNGDLTPCDACGQHAAGRLPEPDLRMTMCVPCHENLAAWLAAGGAPLAWPMLDYAYTASLELAAQATRDAYRDRLAAQQHTGPPIAQHIRDRLTAWRAARG